MKVFTILYLGYYRIKQLFSVVYACMNGSRNSQLNVLEWKDLFVHPRTTQDSCLILIILSQHLGIIVFFKCVEPVDVFIESSSGANLLVHVIRF